jgi:hypothetical protein
MARERRVPKRMKIAVENGLRGKRVAAYAIEWPGLERGGRSEEAAIDALRSYVPRYAKVASLAKMRDEFDAESKLEVVDSYAGTGSTDFWGISFAFAKSDRQRITDERFEREIALLRGCWKQFDAVRQRVTAELRKGPRGGGRDRDRIVRHVIANEREWAVKLGLHTPEEAIGAEPTALRQHRNAYCRELRRYRKERLDARTWPLRFLIRHTAFHVMDHTWEMEDKDLS